MEIIKTIKTKIEPLSKIGFKIVELDIKNCQNEDYQFLEESLKSILEEKLKEEGFKFENLKIGYSLGCCQGDGFNFIGDITKNGYELSIKKISHHYEHSNTTEINFISFNCKSYEGLNSS